MLTPKTSGPNYDQPRPLEPLERPSEGRLAEDGGDPDVHKVPPKTLDREDEKGTDLPMNVIAGLDWMIGQA